ncbi:MAG: hypothetical protein FJ027_16525 [Candidatus Rokubacteria bacterium]|nr:hypothetical protein [Candidatus Rokubacteria bacterium]
MIFFVDRSLGEIDVPTVLRGAGAAVAVHSDLFPDAAADRLWLTECGRRGYVVLTKDHRIRTHEIERRAIVQHKVRAFFLVPRKLTGTQNGAVFAKALDKMRRFCAGNMPPFIAFVYENGRVRLIKRPKH